MNLLIKRLKLQPADRIVVPKSGLGIVQHHVIYLGQNNQGVDLIAENKIGKGVQIVTANDFFCDVIEITRIERFRGSESERKIAVKKALSLRGANYDLFQFNCEHYANVVQHKKRISPQAKAGAALGLFGVLIGILFSLKK
jgi:hypothetical protein